MWVVVSFVCGGTIGMRVGFGLPYQDLLLTQGLINKHVVVSCVILFGFGISVPPPCSKRTPCPGRESSCGVSFGWWGRPRNARVRPPPPERSWPMNHRPAGVGGGVMDYVWREEIEFSRIGSTCFGTYFKCLLQMAVGREICPNSLVKIRL